MSFPLSNFSSKIEPPPILPIRGTIPELVWQSSGMRRCVGLTPAPQLAGVILILEGGYLRRVPAGERQTLDPTVPQPKHRKLGGLPRACRRLVARWRGAGVRRAGQLPGALGHRRAAVRAGAPAVEVRVPPEVRGVPDLDRALVEGAVVPLTEGTAVRDLGRRVPRHRRGDGVLEQAPASVRLGPTAATPAAAPAGHRGRPRYQTTCRMNHLLIGAQVSLNNDPRHG
jgi:hypothetical protein